MLTNSALARLDSRNYLDDNPQTAQSAWIAATTPSVDIAPQEIATRRGQRGDGVAAEVFQTIRPERIDIRFRAPVNLLVIVEEGVRAAGESLVEGLPRSTLRDLRRKLTFVPAGHKYHEWHQPSVPSRLLYFYFDPAKVLFDLEPGESEVLRAPRLFFEDTALWQTALKLGRLLEASDANSNLCLEALSIILVHELVRPGSASHSAEPRARGGLAGWQKRIVIEYIEENLAENIPLGKLAGLIRLSPYHFCRAFKQSFGVPPHRYHIQRRIERAKALLSNPNDSVTNIGMTIGFSETSSFTAVFRKVTGTTPTDYRRSLS